MLKHFNIRIFGRVQDVNFRSDSKTLAESLGIKGFVRNESDGNVYIEVEGEEKDLNTFIAWCRKGTFWARVERIDVSAGPMKEYKNFLIA